MRILHTYCLNYNIGDYALGIGIKNLLRKNLPVSLIGETNLQGRQFTEYYINEVVNNRYDLLIIGGGGVIHGAHWPNGWFWLIDKELIKTIRVPFVVYGVGYNYFRGESGIPERGVVHLKETVRRAAYFSVRNDGSYERLKEQTGLDVPEIPDPGFHIGLDREYPEVEKDPFILIQLANDKPNARFGSEHGRNAFVANMRKVVIDLAKDYRIVLAPHVFEDISLCRAVAENIIGAEIWDFGHFAFDRSFEALAYYKQATMVLAMRGHGQIVPIGFNTPVISLENHAKNIGLMKKLSLEAFNIDVLDQEFVTKANSLTDYILRNKEELKNEYKRINERLSQQTDGAFVSIRDAVV